MAFGNARQGGGGDDTFVRLSGMFPTAKGNLIGRIEASAFNTVFQMMQQAQAIGGTLNIIVLKSKKTGKPEMYGVVGQPYEKKSQPVVAPGPFGPALAPAPVASAPAAVTTPVGPFATATPPAREVQFGQADVPRDDFDSLLESLK